MQLSPLPVERKLYERFVHHANGKVLEKSKTCKAKLTSDREATETPLGLEVLGLANGSGRREDDRVQDETVLVSLNLADHLGLVLGGTVVVNNTEATKQSHVDGHVVLSDSVHGGGHKGGLQRDTLGNRGVQGHIRGGEACYPIC